ncbi:nitric oxide synthase-like protein [Paramacrobiotus metropolitanus]|uniref:nitric oxide synthase-like protein n=1 Tax=Paramacrobiotus metropolitanus TaxID=2943436 RepID=UPI002445D785|nr:nitric oxide synthase-like protein [Paramacrobiotus metropolitanus]XP_055327335.1 nitric oxide synthase-like protein [Paramacrobiotus metropolitanus]
MDLGVYHNSPANCIKIRIIKRPIHGLGFHLKNENNSAVVAGLIAGCEAEKSNLIRIGDRITAVNSISVENMPFEQVLAILGKVPVETPVILLLKGPQNCRTHLVTTFAPDGSPVTIRHTESINQISVNGLQPDTRQAGNPKNGPPMNLAAFGNELQERLSRIEEFIQGTCRVLNAVNTAPVAPEASIVHTKSVLGVQGGRGEEQVVVSPRKGHNLNDDISDNVRMNGPVPRAVYSAVTSIIPSKTGDNDDDGMGKTVHLDNLSTGFNQLAARRGSRLEPELALHLEALRLRSPSPTLVNRKYVKLRNVMDGKTAMDTLHRAHSESVGCNHHRCTASLMNTAKPQNSQARSKEEVLILAKDFIRQYFESIKRLNTPAHETRWAEVEAQIRACGSYEFKEQELTFAAKTAWRNSQRCIGRIQWSKLQVFDSRFTDTPRTMFQALLNHIKYSTNRGNIRSAITIFKQRNNPEQDYRIWNAQLIRYAGYRQEDGSIIGDPASVEFTEVCQKLGWKGPGGRFDVLPIMVSANGQDPELFDLPREVVLEVQIKHAEYTKLENLGLKWYAVPAVSNMTFDVGGVFFPAVAFSGWYMNTEIARDFCDTGRYNLLEDVASVFGFDSTRVSSLWKDQTFLELNKAILHSFQTANVTVVDHHSASESFMKHVENEQKLRGGCPADWVWIVPPLGGSLLPVFHQEMLNYKLSPCYDYQEEAWRVHIWKKDKNKSSNRNSMKRKFGFREIARAVKFSAKLMSKALARRIRATIIYATETGKSEKYARTLFDVFKYGFDVNVISAENYDLTHLEHEALILVVTSTFGNGDPPDNGKDFASYLHQLSCPDDTTSKAVPTYSRVTHPLSTQRPSIQAAEAPQIGMMDLGGPLGNVRYAVFGLGSSSYPHFCAFAHYVDQALNKLGAECILPIHTGDELCGQDQSFKKWAPEVFRMACDVFCLGDDVNMADAKAAFFQGDSSWTRGRYRIRTVTGGVAEDMQTALAATHNKTILTCTLSERKNLQSAQSNRQTVLIHLDSAEDLSYVPGDHVALFAQNDPALVSALLERLSIKVSPSPVQMEVLVEKPAVGGSNKTWCPMERLPSVPLNVIFSSLLDITTPPSQMLLENLASLAADPDEQERLIVLSKNTEAYETWKRFNWPTLIEVLEEFPSIEMDPTLLLVELPLLQPRFYSISSSPLVSVRQVHATVGIVTYQTKNGNGPLHRGVCSSYLSKHPIGEKVYCYLRSAPGFRLPEKISIPIYLIGAGTGIAPFRSFWQHLLHTYLANPTGRKPEITIVFGCRNQKMDHIYKQEIEDLQKYGLLRKLHLALSREPGVPKTYVQDVIPLIGETLHTDIFTRGAHIYVCGDVGMAAGVHDAIKNVIVARGQTEMEAENVLDSLRSGDRYHEDIFGNYNMASGLQ